MGHVITTVQVIIDVDLPIASHFVGFANHEAKVPPRRGGQALIDMSVSLHFGKILAGTAGGFSKPAEDYPRYVDLYLDGRWKLDELVTHTFTLDEINEAADTLRSGKAGRVLLDLN